MSNRVHVLPLNDVVDHDDNEDCFCGPTAKFVEGGVVFVHHSVDGREMSERGSSSDWNNQ